MENAIWKEQIIVASEIADNYEKEKEIRKASGTNALRCQDPNCKNPILKYCHGEKKAPYFSHLVNCECDYADYDKENTPLMRKIKLMIYDSFCKRGYNVSMDVKLLKRHYTHLVISLSDGSKTAIELGTQRTTAKRIDYLMNEYQKIGIIPKWVVISNAQEPVSEGQTFFIKRFQMNESNKKDLLILNSDGTQLAQLKEDKSEYIYNGQKMHSENYPDIYSETSSLDSLDIESGELTLVGFHDRFENWHSRKDKAFRKKVETLKKEDSDRALLYETLFKELKKQREEEKERPQNPYGQPEQPLLTKNEMDGAKSDYDKKIKNGYVPKSILAIIDQQDSQVNDDFGNRWVKCSICGKVAPATEFSSYGGLKRINLGKCYDCTKRQ